MNVQDFRREFESRELSKVQTIQNLAEDFTSERLAIELVALWEKAIGQNTLSDKRQRERQYKIAHRMAQAWADIAADLARERL